MVIRGRVQGVFYRASAQQAARQLGLTGFVKNEGDGSVYAEVEGREDAVQSFIDWCKKGPPAAAVISVEVSEGRRQFFEDFRIK